MKATQRTRGKRDQLRFETFEAISACTVDLRAMDSAVARVLYGEMRVAATCDNARCFTHTDMPTQASLTCPNCQHVTNAEMPDDACAFFFDCAHEVSKFVVIGSGRRMLRA